MFKIGDEVVCKDSRGREDYITEGSIYVVNYVNTYDELLTVVDDTGKSQEFFIDRFKLAEKQQDPMVSIPQSEYDDLIEQINMLQELIAELSGPQPVDTAQEQQAYTYQQMQKVLVGHPSFKELSDGSHCEELVGTIRLLQDAYDELNNDKEFKLELFKPVSEYTMDDWKDAYDNDWVFECRNGDFTKIIGLDYGDTNWPVESQHTWLRLDGTEYNSGSSTDIIRRIK